MSQLQLGPARHQRDAEPGRHHLELVDRARRPANPRGGRRGAAGAAGARLDAGSACRPAASSCPKGVVSIDGHPSRSVTYGALLGDKPFNVKFTGTAPQKPINALQAGRHQRAARRHPRQGGRQDTSTCSTCACPACCTAASCGRAASAPMASAPSPLSDRRELDQGHSRRAIVRKGDFVGVVAEHEWDAVKAARALKVTWQETRDAAGQRRPVRPDARREDHRHRDRGLGRCGEGASPSAAHVATATYYCPYQSHAPFAAELRARRRRPERRAGDVLDPGHLQLARHAGGGAGLAGRQGPRAVCRRLRHLRPQLLRGRRAGRRGDVAGGRQAGARAVHALRRARLGRLRPGASRRRARRRRRQRQDSWPTSTTAGSTAGWSTRRRTSSRCRLPPKERTTGAGSIPVNRMSTGSMYAVANRRVVSHAVPMVGYLKGAPLRSPLDLSFAFASEQTIDELAVMRQDRPARIPAQEHRRRALARRAQRRRRSGGVDAAGRGLGARPTPRS